MDASKEGIFVMKNHLVTSHGFNNGLVKITHPTKSNGLALDTLNNKAFEVFNEAPKQFVAPTTVPMFEWIGKQIMHAATAAVYGTCNPMRDAQNLDA
jgi:hypothetical protein